MSEPGTTIIRSAKSGGRDPMIKRRVVSTRRQGDLVAVLVILGGLQSLGFGQNSAAQTNQQSKIAITEGASAVQLGRIYENLGRLEDAESAYKKALEDDSPAVRNQALAAIKRVAEKQQPNRWSSRFLWLTGVTVAAACHFLVDSAFVLGVALLCGWFYKIRVRRRARGKLAISPFSDSTRDKIGPGLDEVFVHVLDRMRFHFRDRLAIRGQTIPILAQSQAGEVAELIKSLYSGWQVKIFAWFIRNADQPEYSIRGSIQSDGRIFSVFARLERSGRTIKTWNRTFLRGEVAEKEQDLAYEMLIYLKGEMEARRAS